MMDKDKIIKRDSVLGKVLCKHEYENKGLFRKLKCKKCNSEAYVEEKKEDDT